MVASAALAARPERDAVPVLFIANQGQAPAEVHFMAKGSGLTAYFSPGETLFRLGDTLLTTRFVGARPAVGIEGVERLPGQANFLTGPAEEWHLDVPLYGAVRYRELYPGIDMVYGGLRRSLKSEFVVSPGADPSQIRMRYVGAGTLRLDLDGSLVIPVDGRELREAAPTIYQDRGGRRIAIEGRFSLANDGTAGFIIGQYDRDRTLVIDPVLSYSTLLGGSNSDAALAIAVDSTGAAYVAGFTASYDFPKASPLQSSSGGGNDAFVAKLNPAGNGLLYCTYLGGKGDDRAYGLALDSSGAVYITGSTTSQNFPLHNPLQSKLAGGKNAFVAKLSPAGNSLVFSTYLGGNGSDTGNGIAVDSGGNVYLAGDTTSTNFPASTMQTTNRGSQDGFVSKLSADGARLLYSTYLGGSSDDHAAAIALDSSGSAYVTGSTHSTDFPVAAAWQGHLAGGQDAFVAKLAADGNSLVFGTFLGHRRHPGESRSGAGNCPGRTGKYLCHRRHQFRRLPPVAAFAIGQARLDGCLRVQIQRLRRPVAVPIGEEQAWMRETPSRSIPAVTPMSWARPSRATCRSSMPSRPPRAVTTMRSGLRSHPAEAPSLR